ncbi:LacI family DNA-binding transcriptional regulator [Marinimicrobium sp. C6131]|uniref:LacI family DNA-binding transcriptional regulator n=1 Tax=Marinimicrobium sp. C6131 TaxID=3022676 RepID=UPI00223D1732|nr:LacI family DNA-binding transcriptional regulator [Marinimicrobium sp. C6131]UZJ46129.1 LacI family DNA-binding transcriptional regulator [Marinimicrobium sp. C6131]
MSTRARKKHSQTVTLADVAQYAGVSGITVSRVINHPNKVSQTTRQAVQEAIDMLGYIPNQSASSLASTRSRVIGVAIPSLSNIVFTDVLRGIYDVAGTSGYKVLMVDTHYSALEEERMVRTLLSQSPEAMILTGGEQTQACERLLLKARIPVVQIMDLLDEPMDMNVGVSHFQAGAAVAEQLLSAGYGQLGFIGARMDKRVRERLAGFKSVLEGRGRFWRNFIQVTDRPSSIELGGELFRALMGQAGEVVDAVFCCNDDLALGALFESQRMGLDVPGDIGLCGFNDFEVSAFTNPSLSSVAVPRYQMGVTAAEMIVAALNGGDVGQRKRDLGFEIALRQSTDHL